MPCMKCANGKWKYGANGNCVFDTLEACKRAAAAIHIQDSIVDCPAQTTTEPMDIEMQEQYKQLQKVGRVADCNCLLNSRVQ